MTNGPSIGQPARSRAVRHVHQRCRQQLTLQLSTPLRATKWRNAEAIEGGLGSGPFRTSPEFDAARPTLASTSSISVAHSADCAGMNAIDRSATVVAPAVAGPWRRLWEGDCRPISPRIDSVVRRRPRVTCSPTDCILAVTRRERQTARIDTSGRSSTPRSSRCRASGRPQRGTERAGCNASPRSSGIRISAPEPMSPNTSGDGDAAALEHGLARVAAVDERSSGTA